MASISIEDLNNAALDAQHLAKLVSVLDRAALTATDRLGQAKITWTGLVADLNSDAAATKVGLKVQLAADSAASAATSAAAAEAFDNRWPNQTLGLANTEEGRYFSTPSPVSGQSSIIYLKSSGVAVEETRLASFDAVDGLRLGIGAIFPSAVGDGGAGSGAVQRMVAGRPLGWTIPAGQTGVNSYTLLKFSPGISGDFAAAGTQVRVGVLCDVSGSYPKAVTMRMISVPFAGDQRNDEMTSVTRIISAGRLYIEGIFPLIGDEALIAPALFNFDGSAATSDLFLQVADVVVDVVAVSADNVARGMTVQQATAMLAAKRERDRTALDLEVLPVDLFAAAEFVPSMSNGAALRPTAGRASGWTIPAGSSGSGSFILARLAAEYPNAAMFTGQQVRVSFWADVSAGYQRQTTLQMYTTQRDGSTRMAAIDVSSGVPSSSTRRLYSGVYTLQGDEVMLTPYLQNSDTGVAGAEQYLSVVACSMALVGARSGSMAPAAKNVLWGANMQREGLLRETRSGLGPLHRLGTFASQYQDGGTPNVVDGRQVGWSIPPGSAGGFTLVQVVYNWGPTANAPLAGRKLRFAFRLSHNLAANRSFVVVPCVQAPSGTRFPAGNVLRDELVGSSHYIVAEIDLVGDETAFQPIVRNDSTATADPWVLTVETLAAWISYSPDGADQLAAENAALFQRFQAYRNAPSMDTVVDVDMVPVSGVLPSFATRAAAISDASAHQRYDLVNLGGVQAAADLNWSIPDYIGVKRGTYSVGVIPDDTNPYEIQLKQTFYANGHNRFSYATVLAKNARYAIHIESGGEIKDRTVEFLHSHVEHLGNEGAKQHQIDQGLDPGVVWQSVNALGVGLSSGAKIKALDTTFKSRASAVSFHTNNDFAHPVDVSLTGSRLITTTAGGWALQAVNCGSGQPDQAWVVGTHLMGDIYANDDPWMPMAADKQPADHAEITIGGYGNSGVYCFRSNFASRALKIESPSTTDASAIGVSGTAVAAIFGSTVYAMPGRGGIKGYVYGHDDVSEVLKGYPDQTANFSLAARLGDCTGGNSKTLVVTVNGGSAVTHTFNLNYTGVSNATILGQINATLGAAATASLYDISGRKRPRFTDEEQSLQNSSATGLLMGTVCAYDSDARKVRAMTSTDPLWRFAGVAWEDIYPGDFGRVKTSGCLALSDVLRTDSVAIAFGDTFSVDVAAPGKVTKGGTQGLLRAAASNTVWVQAR